MSSSKTKNNGFTLVELMISLLLMVLLMLGVNYIFSAVGKATGAAQAVSRINHDTQATQKILTSDFESLAVNGPCLLISSQVQPAFRNKPDQLGAIDPTDPLVIEDGAGSITQSAAMIGTRSHRLDILSFFARGYFPRMTGDDKQIVADMASTEAWVWYGHLTLPVNNTTTTSYMRAGTGTATSNPNNFYSSQFALGRVATTLVEPDIPWPSVAGKVYDSNGVSRHFMQRKTGSTDHSLSPLSQGTVADDGAKSYTARYDVAGASIERFREYLEDFMRNDSKKLTWYAGLMLDDTDATVGIWRRYWANPYPKRWDNGTGKLLPIDSESASALVPILLNGASSFIVEFAGDYFVQDATGKITAWGTDEETDYRMVNGVRQIRWYGFPRDENNDGKIQATDDVVAIRDAATTATPPLTIPTYTLASAGQIQQAFPERDYPTPAPAPDYAVPGVVTAASAYRVAWGPDTNIPTPTMIRIVIYQDDLNGRLSQPTASVFVFKLK